MDTDLILFDEVHPELQAIEAIPGSWIINNLISPSEAANFIAKVEHDEEIDTRLRVRDDYTSSIHRISRRYKHDLPEIAKEIFNRLQGIAPSQLTFEEEDDELGPFLKGIWNFHSVNEKISFFKYEPGGVFSKHRDGIYIKHEDLRSFITILVYLNNDYTQGRTKIFSDDGLCEISIEPAVGLGFMMIQRILHEGGAVEQGIKHAIRFDLMYHRITSYSPEIQEKNVLAAQYLKMANELERSNQGMEAVKYYQKAFKLNPKLEYML